MEGPGVSELVPLVGAPESKVLLSGEILVVKMLTVGEGLGEPEVKVLLEPEDRPLVVVGEGEGVDVSEHRPRL